MCVFVHVCRTVYKRERERENGEFEWSTFIPVGDLVVWCMHSSYCVCVSV